MSDQAHSWSCPACDRRVPGRLATCRCGYERNPSEARWTDAQGSTAQSGSTFTPARIIVVVLFVVGLAGLTASRMFRTTSDVPASEPLITPATTVVETQPTTTETPASAIPVPSPSAFAPASSAPAVDSTPDTPRSLEDVISRAAPAVVSIETRDGRGSGFFVGPGVLVTNNHVVGTNASVTVRLSSGSTAQGRVERTSPEADLAVVRLSDAAPAQPVLPLGSADEVRVGQEVIAIGLAMGQFQGTVTRGIISAVRRTGPGSNIVLLQTDAAINPGNSGGPLINRQGRVIGITTLKVSGAAESIGFAVAADHARAFLAGNSSQAPTVPSGATAAPPLAPAFTQKSQVDIMREQGLQAFEQSLKTVATRASQIDNYWTQVKRECGGRITGVYDREWFALFENRLTVTSTEPGCLSALNSIRDAAGEVRTAMVTLHENARRASVYPGDLRQIRAKFDLDWTGWER
jgi:S1-C subfamily serine protease